MKDLLESVHRNLWKIKVFAQESIRRYKYRKKIEEGLKYQGMHNNEKYCFIIGNGPSLRKEDLEKLQNNNVVTFAANRIYKIFNETDWRPTYYSVCDTSLYRKSKTEIDSVQSVKFIPLDIYDRYVESKDDYLVFSRVPFTFFKRPRFSNRLDRRFGEGGTITYHLMQLAVSMGFKELYLIGVDFSFSYGIGPDGKYFEDKSIKQNHHKNDTAPIDTMPNLQINLQAYEAAKRFACKNGIKIYNATRGGKLEVYERRGFESLFNKNSRCILED